MRPVFYPAPSGWHKGVGKFEQGQAIMDSHSKSSHADSDETFLQDCLSGLSSAKPTASVSDPTAESTSDSGGDSDHCDAHRTSETSASSLDVANPDTALTPLSPQASIDGESTFHTPPSAKKTTRDVQPMHLATSTFLSLVMVLALLLLARLIVPSLVESIRYGWHRGQLRAEYELSGERLKSVSLDSLSDVSQLVSQRVGPSVVHIDLLRDAEMQDRFDRLLGSSHPNVKYKGQGSGFVIDAKGYILTNQHVVDDVGAIEVTLGDGRRLPATIVGADAPTDLAVLRVEATDLLPIEWGKSDEVSVGTPVWAVGSPFGLQQTVTFGIISGKHRVDFRTTRDAETIRGGTPYGDLMQSDVALNPGNSGGPLANSLGQIVGVNAAILGETFRGVSFSIPSKVAQQISRDLIEKGEVSRGWLGVQLQDLDSEEKFQPNGSPRAGVRVMRFPPNMDSPAQEAGIRVGDLILAFEGISVQDTASLIRLIGETKVGSRVVLTVERDSQKLDIEVQLQRRNPNL